MQLVDVRGGGKRAIANALAQIEADDGVIRQCAMLDDALAQSYAHIIGMTGPPGVGKSTAINQLVQLYRRSDQSVAVVAIDPTSKRTGGALLGDRNRFDLDPADPGILVRSLAARDQLGGLAEAAIGCVVLLSALFDKVIVETVGVGQTETDIAGLSDTTIVAVQPASGDSLQFMKAGIMEIPNILVVTKADIGAAAERAVRDMRMAARSMTTSGSWQVDIVKIAAVRPIGESGIAELHAALERHHAYIADQCSVSLRRSGQARFWQSQLLKSWFGRFGTQRMAELDVSSLPFCQLASLAKQIDNKLRPSTKS